MSRIAYLRVSTVEQNEARQTENLKQYGIDKWFIEKVSAKDANRPKLKELIDYAREGDTIYIHDFSRIARSTNDLLNIAEQLSGKGIFLVSTKENIDTNTPTGKLMLTMIGAINEFERMNLLERQKEGIDYYYDNYGIDIFWVDPIFPPVSEIAEKTYEPIDMMQFATAFVDAHNHAWERGVFYESNLTTNFDGKTDKACRSCLPMPHLTMDGYLSACEMATYGEGDEKMDAMIYAKYDAENDKIVYDENKLKILRSRTLNNMPEECRACAAGEYCAGFCLGETLNENGSLFRVKTRVCRALRYIYGEIGYLYPQKYPKGYPHKHP